MDGPQDLGGKEDFGPIDVASPDFRHDWERRQWALSKLCPVPGITIDWFRHGLENMPPAVYLSVPYFKKWNANEMALGLDAGVYSLSELVSGHAKDPADPAPVQSVDALEDRQRALARSFAVEADTQPLFRVGDRVTTAARPTEGHSRLPAYARAATGTVTHHHGAHLFADAGARGEHIGHHLYTVEFAAPDLWTGADPRDTVRIDLWEPCLDRA
ncbi:nitrile hydratase subunit beta [Silicimonas algicola]|uniref:nitrile hydratase n=1 Tax=Silicimonas algicola TaxID=1826607 RepID=A0A316GMF7_9RHOB|nr:nitrile hydratase subunit beta [Silicimonas algicola]AZQ68846.1 nitrile hydratase subunit beta [Silicimonas algicola]PWK56067.1 nitrile hydratase [Silicimonas algicola]